MRKKLPLLFILSLLFSLKISAQQQYKPCLDGDMVRWSVLSEIIDGWPVSKEFIAYGDTTINGRSYKNIYWDVYSGDPEETNINWKNDIPVLYDPEDYFFRETEDHSKLYILLGDNEYLISDMNLQVGDEFSVPEIWNYHSFRADFLRKDDLTLTVDSVYIKDELKHIRLDYTFIAWLPEEIRYKLTFIEGIGPNIGLTSFSSICLYQLVNCFQNQSLFYKNEMTPYPCGFAEAGGAIQTVSSQAGYAIQVADNHIKIHFLLNKSGRVILYDVSGRVCHSVDFHSGQDLIIPTASFPKGMYLLKVQNQGTNQMNIHKIILGKS